MTANTTLFKQLKLLYDKELYSNAATLACLVLSTCDHSSENMTPQEKFETFIYYADSLYYIGQYRKAETIYRKGLQLKKILIKTNKTSIKPLESDQLAELDIKYKIYQCQMHTKQLQQAINTLQSIPAKLRTPKINIALARLYQQNGMERPAVTAYKEVLKECPLAFDAIEGLLQLGVKGNEVNALLLDTLTALGMGCDWIGTWVRANAHIYSQQYSQAITTLKKFDAHPGLRVDPNIMIPLGECYHYMGDIKNALYTLVRVRNIDHYMTRGLDILASLLHRTHKTAELEQLVSPNLSMCEYTTEVWIALAYHLFSVKKCSRAVYYAQKACFTNPRNVEGLLLKGSILLELKKYQESIGHFREALKLAPHRFEVHVGLVDCYLGLNKITEAANAANNACKELGQTPRPMTMYASVLMKNVHSVNKAKTVLEKVLTQDQSHSAAVLLMVEIMVQQNRYYSAMQLIQKHLLIKPDSRLYQVLGDLSSRPGITYDVEGALNAYSKALSLDPNNRLALQGMNKIDKQDSDVSFELLNIPNEDGPVDADPDTTYDLGVDANPASDTSNGGQESETEAVWSDMELEVNVHAS